MRAQTNLFTQKLRRIERELLAQKCAHDRPAGSISFYTYTVSKPLSSFSYGQVVATLVVDENYSVPAFVQCAWRASTNRVHAVDLEGAKYSSDFRTMYIYATARTEWLASSDNIICDIISTAPLTSLDLSTGSIWS